MLVTMPLWDVERPGEVLISSGLATMGFALPAAIGAAVVSPGRRVICFTGDGGLGMALAELETLRRLQLDVTVVVFNDSLLSLIAAKQKPAGQGGEGAVRHSSIDFAAVGTGFGIRSMRVTNNETYKRALQDAFDRGPSLIDVTVDPSCYREVLDVIRG
jgi:acetolactate synthase-1/2/3 large subunit